MKYALTILLYPFAIFYECITSFRNYLYNIGYKKSVYFDVMTISIGNLSVGGTGKTPHVEYLIQLLKPFYKISTLSRGYGRKTHGVMLADKGTTASEIGDEPMQFYSKFNEEIVVAVGEERILAVPTVLHHHEETQVIILDDAFQHRKIKRDLNILLSDYNHPFYNDFVLPAGRLRESRRGAKRADVVMITKCPENISKEERESIFKKVRKYASTETPVFFTFIQYGTPIAVFDSKVTLDGEILLVSGIANAEGLESFVKANYNFSKHLKFKDHHHYTSADIGSIINEFKKITKTEKLILITEKDMVKWRDPSIAAQLINLPIYYLPIEVAFVDQQEIFKHIVLNRISERLKEIGK